MGGDDMQGRAEPRGDRERHGSGHDKAEHKFENAQENHSNGQANGLDLLSLAGDVVLAGAAGGGLASKLAHEAPRAVKVVEQDLNEILETVKIKGLESVPLSQAIEQLPENQRKVVKQGISELCQAIASLGGPMPIKETLVDPAPNRDNRLYDSVMRMTMKDVVSQIGLVSIASFGAVHAARLIAAGMSMSDKNMNMGDKK